MFEKGNRANTLHGILLIALFSFAAFYLAEIPFVKSLSFSPLIVGIILGMLYANSLRNKLPETWVPGIKFCTKQVLRAGIVLYGFRLTLTDVAAVSLPAVVADTVVVCGTIFLGLWLGKLLRLDRDTSLMTSVGSSICGAAAVLGAEPVVRCEGHKTAIAVSTVVIFGTISMFLYPIMYRAGMLDTLGNMGTAIYTGSTLHEVAHVAGAGEPFILVTTGEPDENGNQPLKFALPAAEADAITDTCSTDYNGLTGTLQGMNISNEASLYFNNSVLNVCSDSPVFIAGRSGYIDATKVQNLGGTPDKVIGIDGIINNIGKVEITDSADAPVNVYTIDGILLKRNVKASEATRNLPKGVYIVGKEKVLVK